MFVVDKVSCSYKMGGHKVSVLNNLSFSVKAGEFVGIQGPSGSGKSTLFYILGFLLKPTHGHIIFDNTDVTQMSTDELTLIRNKHIGFIFQQFHLLPNANCLQNILLPTVYPCELASLSESQEYEQKARYLAKQLGLSHHLTHAPNQLSGGQQQRVAIARALIKDVELILADEPTGNLDSKTAQEIMEILQELNNQGKTIILITHDAEVAKYCSKVYHLRDGSFTHVVTNYQQEIKANEKVVSKQEKSFSPTNSLDNNAKIVIANLPLVKANILRNKMKSFLTMLGVIIGVAVVLVTLTLGQFAKEKILETYESLGVNKLLVRGYPSWGQTSQDTPAIFQGFNLEKDLVVLKKVFTEITMISPIYQVGEGSAIAGGKKIENTIQTLGITSEYFLITNRTLLAGIALSNYHVDNGSPVCVIGYDIAKKLFPYTSAVQQVINVADKFRLNYNCRIIGILNSQTNTHGQSPNLDILLPYTYFKSIAPHFWASRAYSASVQIATGHDVEQMGIKIRNYFVKKYGASGVFSVDSDSTLIAQMKKFISIFTLLLSVISLLLLLVGGIGINNMVLISVTERIKEFGIRKALGATNKTIRMQVLLESLGICMMAGFLGLVIGFGAYEVCILLASKWVANLQFTWIFLPGAMLLSFCAIIVVGILSGLIPAIRAEKLEIIEALRAE